MKKSILVIATILVAMQFYRPYKNSSTKQEDNDFLIVENAPEHIAKIFKTSCYDCHSNHTNYRWYDNIAPLSWYIDANIKRAKFSLNFSEWGTFEPWRRRLFFQGGIPYDIEIEKMPPNSYLLAHPEAKVSNLQREQLEGWINSIDLTKE